MESTSTKQLNKSFSTMSGVFSVYLVTNCTLTIHTVCLQGNYPDSVLLEATTTEASYPHDKEVRL